LYYGIKVYVYFYKIEFLKKKEIESIKKDSLIIGKKINELIIIKMGIEEKYELKEIINEVKDNFKDFKNETRAGIKGINDKIDNMIDEFTRYMIKNDNRLGKIEGNHKVTKAQVAIYVVLASTVAMQVFNFYM